MPQATTSPNRRGKITARPAAHAGPRRPIRTRQQRVDAERRSDLYTVLKHFSKLCGHSQQAFDWVMGWIAAPLQQPGRKLRTGLHLSGPAGSGKTLTANMLYELYSEGQAFFAQPHHLLSYFNDYLVDRHLLLVEEPGTKGWARLMPILANDFLTIDTKGRNLRKITNTINVVVTSTETPDPDDVQGNRRWMFLVHREVLDQQELAPLRNAWERHGREAFYAWLLARDISTFGDSRGLLAKPEEAMPCA